MTRSTPRARENLSPAAAHYLTAIYELEEAGRRVTTSALARKLALAPASVTGMLQKLAAVRPRLVDYEAYHGVGLTLFGCNIARETVGRRQVLEQYLARALGYDPDAAAAEAEKLERVISREFVDRISTLLANRTGVPGSR